MTKYYRCTKDNFLWEKGAILKFDKTLGLSGGYLPIDEIWNVTNHQASEYITCPVIENNPDWFERVYPGDTKKNQVTPRRINGSNNHMNRGDTAEVVGVEANCLSLKNFGGGYDPDNFELVTAKKGGEMPLNQITAKAVDPQYQELIKRGVLDPALDINGSVGNLWFLRQFVLMNIKALSAAAKAENEAANKS